MAEVKRKNSAKSKKSSKVLVNKISLTNEELLEQIINKKKNKLKNNSDSSKKKVVTNSSKSVGPKKNSTKIKVEVSSDDIYEKIKAKRAKKNGSSKGKNKLENTNYNSSSKKLSSKVNLDGVDEKFTKSIKEINEENTDLIITREIRFDDLSSNFKNKKILDELRNAIEEYDKLDGYEFGADSLKDDIDILPSVKYSNYKLKKKFIILGIFLAVIIFVVGVFFGITKIKGELFNISFFKSEEQKLLDEKIKFENEAKAERKRKNKLYSECLNKKVTDADYTEEIKVFQNDLKNYIKDNYSASVSYEDLMHGYSFNYDENHIYYAASTIKTLSALYIYINVSDNKIDLNDTITYTSKYKVSYSSGVSKHKLGSEISIRDLVKYSIIYSDNSAHQMLISYIGRSKLKEFGKSLGAKNTLNGGDNFGNISSYDGLIYMKSLNNFIENNEELGKELKNYFVASQQNEISINNLEVAHKYGLYKKNYHNMGIVYDDSPYVISIMTLEGLKDKESAIINISQKIYELHNLFKTSRENICKVEVYGNEKSTNT